MSDQGFNFRTTSGYVTDGTDETYVLEADGYPITRDSKTFGWDAAMDGVNRDSGVDRRFAGIHYTPNDGTQRTFRVDVSAAEYNIRTAIGDTGFAQGYQYFQFKDDTTVISTVDDTDGTSTDNYTDASGVNRTEAAWAADNAAVNHTFSSTIFRVIIGSTALQSDSTTIAHLFLEEVAAGGTVNSRTLSDSIDITDPELKAYRELYKLLTDNIELVDIIIISLQTSVKEITLIDEIEVVDNLIKFATLFKLLSENVILSDSVNKSLEAFKALTENISLSDSVLASLGKVISKLLSDNIDIKDSSLIDILRNTLRSLVDNVTVTDELFKSLESLKVLSDNVDISDALTKSLIQALRERLLDRKSTRLNSSHSSVSRMPSSA